MSRTTGGGGGGGVRNALSAACEGVPSTGSELPVSRAPEYREASLPGARAADSVSRTPSARPLEEGAAAARERVVRDESAFDLTSAMPPPSSGSEASVRAAPPLSAAMGTPVVPGAVTAAATAAAVVAGGLPAIHTYPRTYPLTSTSGLGARVLHVLRCDPAILVCPIWYGAAVADGRGRRFVYEVRDTWTDCLVMAVAVEEDVMQRLCRREAVLDVETLVLELTHVTTDGGLSWGARRGRVHGLAGRQLICYAIQFRQLRSAYVALCELFSRGVRRVHSLLAIHSQVQLLADQGDTEVRFQELFALIDEQYFGGHAAGSESMWFGFRWQAGWSGYRMAQQLHELATRLVKGAAEQMERFDEVVRAARAEAIERRHDEARRVSSNLHDRFVNIRQPTAGTLKAIIDILKYDDAGLEPLPDAAARPSRRTADSHAGSIDIDEVAGKVAEKLSLDSATPAPLALSAMPAPASAPPATIDLPEVKAIMAEPDFAERVRKSGVKVSSTKCLDVVRNLASGKLEKLAGVSLQWYDVWNHARSTCAHGKGEFGLLCCVCAVCNTKMTEEISYNEWVNPGRGADRRDIRAVPAHMIVTHTPFQCFQHRKLVENAVRASPDLSWMLAELEGSVVQRILVAAMIHQERARK